MDKIKERCGVLAYIADRRINKDYSYLLKAYDEKDNRAFNIIKDKYSNKVQANELILIYDFARSLLKLNHRGYDGYGYSLSINKKLYTKVFEGKVSVSSLIDSIISHIDPGECFSLLVGHVRYSTNDSFDIRDNQPYQSMLFSKAVGICFNGNIDLGDFTSEVNNNLECKYMLDQLPSENQLSDEKSEFDLLDLSIKIKDGIRGAFSSLLYDVEDIYVLRDNMGIRPLVEIKSHNLYIISSESCIGTSTDFTLSFLKSSSIYSYKHSSGIKDLEVNSEGQLKKEYEYGKEAYENLCSFEAIYFSSSSSKTPRASVKELRYSLGSILAKREKILIDEDVLLAYIPESSFYSGLAYSHGMGLKLSDIIKKSSSYERSFIKKLDEIEPALNDKFIIDRERIRGKRLILVDDSLVRGNTIRHLSEKLKSYGASEIHLRISSPIIKRGCELGVNINKDNLLYKGDDQWNIEKICEELNIDSLVFIEIEDLIEVLGKESCLKCFNS